ncbi:MAG: helix-turn-helix domain-containing protein [Oscillospiraceae bacterium]|nr:helix-turn-helix domain-containing protein [Oscillospiraceae bacterium]
MIKKKLKDYRKANKLTQQQVADALNIERSTYAYYENGKHLPNVGILSKLSRIYDVPIDCILGNAKIHDNVLEDESHFYEETKQNKADDDFLSSISKIEQDILILFRVIRDKDAAINALKKISQEEDN